MNRQVARTAGQRKRARRFAGTAVGAQFSAAFVAFGGNGGGDFAVEHVDRAADCARAIHQRRGAAQHLNVRGQHRLGGDGVVGADGGGIVDFSAVGQHFDARAVHAANDGATGTGAKVAAADAWLARQRLAQRGRAAARQLVALEHADWRSHVAGTQLQAAGGDGDFGQGLGLGASAQQQ